MDMDAVWRAQRKITSRFFAPAKLDEDLAKISEAERTAFMHDLLIDPEVFRTHLNRATASFSSIALFGQRATSMDDFWATGAYEAMEAVNAALNPGSYPPVEQSHSANGYPSHGAAGLHAQRLAGVYRLAFGPKPGSVLRLDVTRETSECRLWTICLTMKAP